MRGFVKGPLVTEVVNTNMYGYLPDLYKSEHTKFSFAAQAWDCSGHPYARSNCLSANQPDCSWLVREATVAGFGEFSYHMAT